MDSLGIVQRIGNGELIEEMAAKLATVAAAVVETGKAGSVVVTLKISTRAVGDDMVIVEDSVTPKLPPRTGRGAILYALDGDLFTRDPRQTEMVFRSVETDADVRETDDDQTVREA